MIRKMKQRNNESARQRRGFRRAEGARDQVNASSGITSLFSAAAQSPVAVQSSTAVFCAP